MMKVMVVVIVVTMMMVVVKIMPGGGYKGDDGSDNEREYGRDGDGDDDDSKGDDGGDRDGDKHSPCLMHVYTIYHLILSVRNFLYPTTIKDEEIEALGDILTCLRPQNQPSKSCHSPSRALILSHP